MKHTLTFLPISFSEKYFCDDNEVYHLNFSFSAILRVIGLPSDTKDIETLGFLEEETHQPHIHG